MDKNIYIKYDRITKDTTISNDGVYLDTSRIYGVELAKWIYPFHINGIKWYGLYEELRRAFLHKTFTIVFDGENEDFTTLKNALKDKGVEFKEKISRVVILYDDKQINTKITIDGKIFDTQRIERRSVDEWVRPFSFKIAEWKGIFGEIEEYLGNDSYSISFVGNPDDMNILMDNAPANISIYYKPPVVPQKHTPPQSSISDNLQPQNTSQTENKTSLPNMNNIRSESTGFISGAKAEQMQMKSSDSGLLMFGQIATIAAVICCIIFTVFMSRFMMILSIIPSIVFCILAFLKGYKKLAICTLSVILIFAIASWIIVSIRWAKAINDIGESLNESFSSINDVFN